MEVITIQRLDGPHEISVLATNSVSDGYHTFGELYDHRITLFITLCRLYNKHEAKTKWITGEPHVGVWRSQKHSDNTMFDGWFVMGMGTENGQQITYHLPLSRWDETSFADTIGFAPVWDGHTPQDTLDRLKKL